MLHSLLKATDIYAVMLLVKNPKSAGIHGSDAELTSVVRSAPVRSGSTTSGGSGHWRNSNTGRTYHTVHKVYLAQLE